MPIYATRDLPGTGGEFRATPDDLSCEEILVRQAGGTGAYFWVKAVNAVGAWEATPSKRAFKLVGGR